MEGETDLLYDGLSYDDVLITGAVLFFSFNFLRRVRKIAKSDC